MSRNITAIATDLAIQYGSEPIMFLLLNSVYYADRALGSGDGSSIANAKGSIIHASAVQNTLKSDSRASIYTVDFVLDDSDGALKTLMNGTDIFTLDADVYLGYPNGHTAKIVDGVVTQPCSWSEADRTISITVETKILDKTVGYAVTTTTYPNAPDALVGKSWPIVFGTIQGMEPYKLNKVAFGTLKKDCWQGDATTEVEGGDQFPQGTSLDLIMGGNKVTGTFNNNILTIANYNNADGGLDDLYTNISVGPRVVDDGDYDNKWVIWLASSTYLIAGLKLFGLNNGGWNYCYKQEGTKCYLRYPTSGTSPLESGTITNAGAKGMEDWGSLNWTDWCYRAGTPIMLATASQEYYICDYRPNGSVINVWTEVEDAFGKKSKVVLPSSFYTVNSTFNTQTTLGITDGPTSCTVLALTKPLQYYTKEKFSDKIWVDVTGGQSTQNTATQISTLLTSYSNILPDTTTFNAVTTLLDKYPSNFYINKQLNVLDLVEEMCRLSRCAIQYDAGYAYISYLSAEPSSVVMSLTTADIIVDSLVMSFTDSVELVTRRVGTWYAKYNQDDAYKEFVETNITKYGTNEEETNMFIYTQKPCVIKTLQHWLNKYGNIWKTVSFRTALNTLALNVFDAVNLTSPHIASSTIKCIVQSVNHNPEDNTITLNLWTPVLAGTMVASPLAWQVDTGDTKPILTVSATDYTYNVFAYVPYEAGSGGGSSAPDPSDLEAGWGIIINGDTISLDPSVFGWGLMVDSNLVQAKPEDWLDICLN